MTDEATAAILRFRDLNLTEGETVSRHRAVIGSDGSVWWGWWAQGDEQVPEAAFRTIATRAAAGGVDLWLFDSGQGLAYRARCVELKWDPMLTPLVTPDRRLTPLYYVDRSCRTWFRFTEIQEVSFDALRSFSYVEVPELFGDPITSNYAIFRGKRVMSANELQHQRRTVWFVRPYTPSDRDDEIILVGSEVVEPQDFTRHFVEDDQPRLLWLSDLHFSDGPAHAFPPAASPDGNELPLSDSLRRELQHQGDVRLAGVIVSGDITWRADPNEFRRAAECLRQIADWAGFHEANSRRVGVVPGNHDLRFSATPENPEARVDVVTPESREAYATFYKDLFHRPPNEFMSAGRRFLLGRSIPVEIVLLNSSLLEQVTEPPEEAPGVPVGEHRTLRFQGQGFVGDRQLEKAAEDIGWTGARKGRSVRIVVLHHHLVPVPYSEPARFGANYSTVLDAGRLSRWLVDHRVDIVLHGHQHEPFVARLSRPIMDGTKVASWHSFYVLGMGSTGVAVDKRPRNVPNVFAVLTFGSGGDSFRVQVDVKFWSIDPTIPSTEVLGVVLQLGS